MNINLCDTLISDEGREEEFDYVTGVAFSPDGTTLASVSRFARIQLWDPSSRQEVKRMRARGEFFSIGYSANGRSLAVGGGGVDLWDIQSGTMIKYVPDSHFALAFHPRHNYLAVSSSGVGAIVSVWDLDGDKTVQRIGHTEGVSSLAFSPNGSLLAVGAGEKVYLWEWLRKDIWCEVQARADRIVFDPSGNTFATNSPPGVELWNVSQRHEHPDKIGDARYYGSQTPLAFSADGGALVYGEGRGALWLWDLASKERTELLARDSGFEINDLAFSASGRHLVVGGSIVGDGREVRAIQLWEVSH